MKRPILNTATAIVMLMAGTVFASAQSTDADTATPPAAGETSDRTPQAKTETPLSQRDKTTADPSGSAASPPQQGTTSDRTPDGTSPDDRDASAVNSDSKGKTTTGEDAQTNKY